MIRDASSTARRAHQRRFQNLVSRVIESLPAEVHALLDNVAIVVESEPSSNHLSESNLSAEIELYGLYQGIPRTDRNSAYSLVTPDQITIFSGPLERECASRRELERQIRITVLHELGHHLGFDENGLDVIGLS